MRVPGQGMGSRQTPKQQHATLIHTTYPARGHTGSDRKMTPKHSDNGE